MPLAYKLMHVLDVSLLYTVRVTYRVHRSATDRFALLACVHWLQCGGGIEVFAPFSLLCRFSQSQITFDLVDMNDMRNLSMQLPRQREIYKCRSCTIEYNRHM